MRSRSCGHPCGLGSENGCCRLNDCRRMLWIGTYGCDGCCCRWRGFRTLHFVCCHCRLGLSCQRKGHLHPGEGLESNRRRECLCPRHGCLRWVERCRNRRVRCLGAGGASCQLVESMVSSPGACWDVKVRVRARLLGFYRELFFAVAALPGS